MTNTPLVSVITPMYNRAQYIHTAVNMLKRQTLKDIQFILIDDGSNDDSYHIALEEVRGDNRFIVLLNSKNKGPCVARNKGLKKASGKYIGFFDIDDEIPDNYFEELTKKAESTSADIVFTNYNDITHTVAKQQDVISKYDLLRNGAIWDKLYKKDLINKHRIQFTPKLYCADNLFVITCWYYAKKIELVQEPTYSYALHEDSIGSDAAKAEKRKKDAIIVCKKAIDFAEDHRFSVYDRLALCDFLKRSFICYWNDATIRAKLCKALWPLMNVSCGPIPAIKLMAYRTFEFLHLMDHSDVRTLYYTSVIEHSPLFDAKYYINKYPDISRSTMTPARHYALYGWKEDRTPSLIFDGTAYLKKHKNVANARLNPLVHFTLKGYQEGRVYVDVLGNERGRIPHITHTITNNIKYALTYPIRVKEKYDHLMNEIQELEELNQ